MDKMQALAHFSPTNKLGQVQQIKILKIETIFKDLVCEIYDASIDENQMDLVVMDLVAVKHKLVHAITHTKHKTQIEKETKHGKEKSSKKDNKKSNENLQVIEKGIPNENEI